MKIFFKWFVSLLFITTVGCHYHRSNLIIRNKTNKKIFYSTLAKEVTGEFYNISSGGQVESDRSDSPFIRGRSDGFKTDIDSYSDKLIYIAFFESEEKQYVYKNVDSMMKTGKLKVMKFSKKELDSLDWEITYIEK